MLLLDLAPIIGGVVLLVALVGRRVPARRLCRRCGQELSPETAPERCVECGAELAPPGAIRVRRRRARPGLAAIGGTILLVGLGLRAALLIGGVPATRWEPLWSLRMRADGGATDALDELVRRLDVGALDAGAAGRLVELALGIQRDATRDWDLRWGRIIEQAWHAALVEDGVIDDYFAGMVDPAAAAILLRDLARSGGTYGARLEAPPVRGAAPSMFLVQIGFESILFDEVPAQPQRSGHVSFSPTAERDDRRAIVAAVSAFPEAGTTARATARFWTALVPAESGATSTAALRAIPWSRAARQGGRFGSGRNSGGGDAASRPEFAVARGAIERDAPVTFVAADEPILPVVEDAELVDRIRSLIGTPTIERRDVGGRTILRWFARTEESPVSAQLLARLVVAGRDDPALAPSGRVMLHAGRAGLATGTAVHDRLGADVRVTLVLAPDLDQAEGDPAVESIPFEELVFGPFEAKVLDAAEGSPAPKAATRDVAAEPDAIVAALRGGGRAARTALAAFVDALDADMLGPVAIAGYVTALEAAIVDPAGASNEVAGAFDALAMRGLVEPERLERVLRAGFDAVPRLLVRERVAGGRPIPIALDATAREEAGSTIAVLLAIEEIRIDAEVVALDEEPAMLLVPTGDRIGRRRSSRSSRVVAEGLPAAPRGDQRLEMLLPPIAQSGATTITMQVRCRAVAAASAMPQRIASVDAPVLAAWTLELRREVAVVGPETPIVRALADPVLVEHLRREVAARSLRLRIDGESGSAQLQGSIVIAPVPDAVAWRLEILGDGDLRLDGGEIVALPGTESAEARFVVSLPVGAAVPRRLDLRLVPDATAAAAHLEIDAYVDVEILLEDVAFTIRRDER